MKLYHILLILISVTCSYGQAIIEPDYIVIGADQLPTGTSSDSVFYFHKKTLSWRSGVFEGGMAKPTVSRKYNAAWGRNNNIGGDFSTGWGNTNQSTSLHGTVWGETNTSAGTFATVWGKNNEVYDSYSTAWGFGNFINADYSTTWGRINTTNGSDQTVWGTTNTTHGQLNTIWGRSNFCTDTLSTGWGEKNVITGGNSTAWGAENKAKGDLSTIWGGECQANGALNTVWGLANQADSIGATAWGILNKSQNYYATVWGRNNEARGQRSTVFGKDNKAYGNQATIMGEGNGSYNGNCLIVGQYNEFSNGGVFIPIDTPEGGITIDGEPIDLGNSHQLFVVGNGEDDDNRSNALTVTRKGYVGIGVSYPESQLHIEDKEAIQLGDTAIISGNGLRITTNSHFIPASTSINLGSSNDRWGRVYTVAGVVTTSDIRLKENILPVTEGINKIMQLSPISYNLKSIPNSREIGFSAQELEKVIPEAVEKNQLSNDNGIIDYTYGVNYDEIIPVLTQAIKEQQAMIQELKAEIEILKNE